MSSSAPSQSTVLEVVDELAPPGTPLTTPEVATRFECTDRTIYNKLDALVKDGPLETKKVGAKGRVWWRPLREYKSEHSSRDQSEITVTDTTDFEQTTEDEDEHRDVGTYITESTFRQLFESINMGLCIIEKIDSDPNEPIDFRYVEANPAFETHTGVGDGAGKTIREMFPGESEDVYDIYDTVLQTGESVQFEYELERADCWLELVAFRLEDEERKLGVIFRNVTERKRAEQALRESEERYRELFESMTEGFCVLERINTDQDEPVDFRYIETNPAFSAQSGIENVVGQTMREVVPDEASEWIEIYDTIVQTGEAKRFERNLNAQGRTLELYAFLIGDGTEKRIGVIFQDITERKRREKKLRRSEEIHRLAVVGGGMGSWEWNVDSRQVRGNETFMALFGLPPLDEAVSADVFLERMSPEDAAQCERIMSRALTPGEEFEGEIHLSNIPEDESEDGRWITWRGRAGIDNPSRITGVSFDITEDKRREEELRERAKLDAFRVELTDTIRSLTDPVEVQQEAACVLGKQLNVDRANYCEVLSEDGRVMVHSEYLHGDIQSAIGEHHIDDFGQHILESLQAGDAVVVDDLRADPQFNKDQRASYLEFDIRSLAVVPIIKKGQCTAYVVVNQKTPREWSEIEIAMVRETAERTWEAVERTRTEKALARANDALERLNEASQELMRADTTTIATHTDSLARTVLGTEYIALWRYNETTGEFQQCISYADSTTGPNAIELPADFTDQVWQAFIHDEMTVENDLTDASERSSNAHLRSCIIVPLGRYGALCAGATEAGMIDDVTVDLSETLAATIEAAWDRATSEQQLARQNEELARLDRLNALIREIDKALVEADSRSTINRAVCERLAESKQYEFAWIGVRDAVTDTILPQEWAGIDSGYIDNLSVSIDEQSLEQSPIAAAALSHQVQVVSDIATETQFTPVREATLERGARSCISVPLVYEEDLYGVLSIYAHQPQPDERDFVVFEELGQTIAHAINAIETSKTLQANRVIELTVRSREAKAPLCQLARKTDCTIAFEGLVHRMDGEPDVFFTAEGVSSEELLTAGEESSAIQELICIVNREQYSLFRARLVEPTLVSQFIEHNVLVRAYTIKEGTATAVVDLPHTANARQFITDLQEFAPDIELLARQGQDRPLKTQQTFRTICEEHMTAKQQTVLHTAYLSGFFESPRVRTGKEVSASLDISQPTFINHLRAGQRAVYEVLFEDNTMTID